MRKRKHPGVRITREWSRATGRHPGINEVNLTEAHLEIVICGGIPQAEYEEAIAKAEAGTTVLLSLKDRRFYIEASPRSATGTRQRRVAA